MRHFNFERCRVMVVGDLMLDRYVSGSVGRISPEAPVPVLLKSSERAVLGGAGNVAANLASLGAEVRLVGVVGDDEPGAALTDLLAADPRVLTSGIVRTTSRPTTCKTRVMSGLHQIVRLDSESDHPLDSLVEDQVVSAIRESIASSDVVVLSDYAKGLCSDRVVRAVLDEARRFGKASIVDPKRRDFSIYSGAMLLKPNRRELSEATGLPCDHDEDARKAAQIVIDQTGAAILLTRSERGMSHFAQDESPRHLQTAAQKVYDVSGAGDTVIALAALGMAAKLPTEEMMRLANAAAGIVVSKVGTAVVNSDELNDALNADGHAKALPGRLMSLSDAVQRRLEWKRAGLKVGFTNGCFDILHPGHVSLIRQAADACDRLILAINSDNSVRRLKGETRPVQDEHSRAFVLGALTGVDMVLVFDEDTPAEVIEALRPDLLVKGADYTESQVVGADLVRAIGGEILLVPLVAGQSTTAIVGRARN